MEKLEQLCVYFCYFLNSLYPSTTFVSPRGSFANSLFDTATLDTIFAMDRTVSVNVRVEKIVRTTQEFRKLSIEQVCCLQTHAGETIWKEEIISVLMG